MYAYALHVYLTACDLSDKEFLINFLNIILCEF